MEYLSFFFFSAYIAENSSSKLGSRQLNPKIHMAIFNGMTLSLPTRKIMKLKDYDVPNIVIKSNVRQ